MTFRDVICYDSYVEAEWSSNIIIESNVKFVYC